jgi:KaiC/GvpD/RAD55 family RecA-like ATPase
VRPDKGTPAFETTGDVGLDRVLGGGIPSRSIVVIAGEPGSGKTILTLQTLFHAAKQGKKSLYFTTVSEPAVKVIRFMQMFDFFDVDLLDKQVFFADLAASIRGGVERILTDIETRVEKLEPAFVVIDSFRAIGELLRGHQDLRRFVYDLAVQMAGWGATTFLVGEYIRDEYSAFAEFAIADGIIRLGSERQELTSMRELEVLKLRHWIQLRAALLRHHEGRRFNLPACERPVGPPVSADRGPPRTRPHRRGRPRRSAGRRPTTHQLYDCPGRYGRREDPSEPSISHRRRIKRGKGDPVYARGDSRSAAVGGPELGLGSRGP